MPVPRLGSPERTVWRRPCRAATCQVGYNVLSQVAAGGGSLTPYVRMEKVDTQATT